MKLRLFARSSYSVLFQDRHGYDSHTRPHHADSLHLLVTSAVSAVEAEVRSDVVVRPQEVVHIPATFYLQQRRVLAAIQLTLPVVQVFWCEAGVHSLPECLQ